jgi:hypothetical protein
MFMEEIIETAERWTGNLEQTTKMLLDLKEDTKLPNGWGKRELLVHLSGWDKEFISFAEEMKKMIKFYPFYEEEGEAKNQQFFKESKNSTDEEVHNNFLKFRNQLKEVYRDLIENYPQENKEFTYFFSIWMHDVHHLKQAGCDISHLEE